jgi:8-oxo-dGTP pyrophosphatase MutT (NUDIX family)
MPDSLRERATVVVIRDGRVLLARDVGSRYFNMPGGGIEEGEPPEEAAVRELREETGLTPTRTESLFVWESAVARHHVFRIDAEGTARIGDEVVELVWWDRKEALTMNGHVEAIIERL